MEQTLDLTKKSPVKVYSDTEQYCQLRTKGFEPLQAYRIAKGIDIKVKVSDRTVRYQEMKYRQLCLDARKLPEIQLSAFKTYHNLLKGKPRKIDKVTKEGEVVTILEYPPFAVQADLAKDTLEHNNPTIKAIHSISEVSIAVIDLSEVK